MRRLRPAAWMLVVAGLACGCNSERTPATLPGAHPTAWMDGAAADFHGRIVLLSGTESCAHCHGIDGPGGRVDVSCTDCHGPETGDCTACHGGLDNPSGAPPYGLRGESADTLLAVGAHSAHLDLAGLGAPVPCNACHSVPVFLLSSDHLDQARPSGQPLDSIPEITWHGIADGGSAAWNRSARTCSGTYCHGAFSGGSGGTAGNAPVWTASHQAACGSCHDVGSNPRLLGGRHRDHVAEEGFDCVECHATVVTRQLDISNPSLHVDRRKTVAFLRGGTFQNGSCSGLNNSACHGRESWNEDRQR
ncbi:MAG: CxxxxCH/CxxCH domain-containing protein [Candidatus Eisenbacteria bacterium]